MDNQKLLSQMTHDEIQVMSEEQITQLFDAEIEYYNNLPHKKFIVATHGSKTKNGGLVNAFINQEIKIEGHLVAVVGDEVVYSDGSKSKIISGAGKASKVKGHSLALVGSHLDNGDEIIDSLQSSCELRLYLDKEVPDGFLKNKIKED